MIKVKKLNKEYNLNICLIPNKLFKSLNLNLNTKYNINLGQLSISTFIKPNKSTDENMYFSNKIFSNLHLLEDINLNIWRNNKDIYLGPVVGFFVDTRVLTAILAGKPYKEFREVSLSYFKVNTNTNCLLYYFSKDDINSNGLLINGYIYSNKEKKWKSYKLPIPNVIYNRCEEFNIHNYFKGNKNIKFINPDIVLDKWHFYKKLFKYKDIEKYLIKTTLYKGFENIKKMLNKCDSLFIKAYHGSRGKQVLYIKRNEEGFEVELYLKGLKRIQISDMKELEKIVGYFTGDGNFIVQERINLIKYKDRFIDIRVLIQKNISGNWYARTPFARIGKGSFAITNYSAGGDGYSYTTIYPNLNKYYKNISIPTSKTLKDIAIKIATYIDKEYGDFGEIGIDLAIDENGKIYFIEGNEFPAILPNKLKNKSLDKFSNILEYAIFLSKKR
ncbi:MAG: YheC/YheD family protein [Firmicutes bacterium]|nr:YheC/YheD family protein [Bacillota bacterium]